ncbi:MAG TPA: BON domain-containing protein [Steroidobacteraceae bacterium]|nr:BON domain-containing protein [Steroidobacteraceae bacterium]
MRHASTILAATAVVVLVCGCNLIKGKETTGQYVDDATLSTRAKAALVKDSTVSATDFDIEVYKGNVTLTGVAKNAGEVNRAMDDIKAIPGVVSVKNATRLATAERGNERSE